MLISTGMRTDIPAYFSDWFYNRIREQYVLTRNPYYPEQVTRYRLTPDVVDCLEFCTKNPAPMLDRMAQISQYHQYWFVTITPYGKEIEPHVPEKRQVMESLIRLSRMVGPSCVGWRYDPVFLTDKYDLSFHIRKFEEMAAFLAGHVDHCVISFIDLYEKTKRNFPQAREVRSEEQMTLGRAFAEIGQTYGIAIRSCCESAQLASVGIDVSGCMTRQVLERAVGASLTIAQKKKPLRESCSCVLGNDIGMYNTCGHGCLYCYANYDQKSVRANQKLHDPESPFLIGGSRPGDRIHEAKQESYIDGQMTLWSDWIG